MYYQHLNLGISSILKDDLKLYEDNPEPDHYRLSILDLNPDFVKLIEKLGLVIMLVEVFRLKSSVKKWDIHIDGFKINDVPKLNFVHGNQISPMIWYKLKDGIDKPPIETIIGTPYITFSLDEVDEVDRTFIQYPTIVQAGTPHTVELEGDQTRWAVSISFFKNWQPISFVELVNIFKNYQT